MLVMFFEGGTENCNVVNENVGILMVMKEECSWFVEMLLVHYRLQKTKMNALLSSPGHLVGNDDDIRES